MRLQNRDIEIINFINEHKGVTVEQAARLYFGGSKSLAYRRLRLLKEAKQLKAEYNPFVCCLVYYVKKMPSLHALMLTAFYVVHHKNITNFKREAQIGNQIVDGLVKFNDGTMAAIEAVVNNPLSVAKAEAIKGYFNAIYNNSIDIIAITLCRQYDREKYTHIQLSDLRGGAGNKVVDYERVGAGEIGNFGTS